MHGLPEVPGVTHRRVLAGDISMHVAEAGAGAPLLLVHGWPQHWYCWRHLIPELAKTHRVICPDLRGLGWSDAPARGYDKQTLAEDLLHLLDTLGLDHVSYVGHDWGAYAGYLLALTAPERIDRLALLGIATPGGTRPRLAGLPWAPALLSYQYLLALPGIGPRALTATSALLRAVFRVWPTVELDEVETYFERLREPERAHASSRYYRTFLTRELPATLSGRFRHRAPVMPTCRVLGENDFLRRLVEDEPGTRIVPGAGHFVQEERPEAVLEILKRFLDDERPLRERPSAAIPAGSAARPAGRGGS